jgi:tyrosinase
MAFIRKNAWNHGGTFENPDLLWYAKAVSVMKSRPISDATSWWFYAAIHGQYLIEDPNDSELKEEVPIYPDWKAIKSIPASANLSSMDTPNELTKLFWDQCQHNTDFFLP